MPLGGSVADNWWQQLCDQTGGHPLVVAAGIVVACAAALFGLRLCRRRPRVKPSEVVMPAPPVALPAAPDPFLFGGRQERRGSARRGGSSVSVLIADTSHGLQPFEGHVVDRSVGGLGLEVGHEVAAGTILNVRPAQAAPIIPWIQVQVRHCKKTRDAWRLGCQFVRVPPSSVLWQFG